MKSKRQEKILELIEKYNIETQEELIARARVSRAVVEVLAQNGALGDLPVNAQLSLF